MGADRGDAVFVYVVPWLVLKLEDIVRVIECECRLVAEEFEYFFGRYARGFDLLWCGCLLEEEVPALFDFFGIDTSVVILEVRGRHILAS